MRNTNYRFLTLLCLLFLGISTLFAVPAYRGWQQRTLSDGSTITVRLVGDEFYHFWETEDGKIATMQDDGTFVVTSDNRPTAKKIAKLRKASPMYKTTTPRKVGGHNMAPRGLVILVNFSDVSFNSANSQSAMNDLMNSTNYTHNSASGSVREYFRAQSNGQYVPDFDVVGPVTLANTRASYGGNTSSQQGSDTDPAQMIVDACKAVDASVNFATYDNDNDGEIDFVYVIYAGYGEADGGPTESIWPHNWYVSSGAGYTCYLDGKKLDNYACSGELNYSDDTRTGIGTIAHEFGHVIGLPDYYDTDYGTNDDNGVTPYKWSIMDQGSYLNGGRTPPNYSVFDKYYMGWITPKFLAKDEKKNVTLTTAYDDGYQITGGASRVAYTNTNTVYYIENRQKSGWDAYIPGSGMLVWQVKYSQSVWNNNQPNNTAGSPRYTIVPADGKTTNFGRNASDAFPTSSVTTYTPFTGCELTEIAKSGSNITFKYNGGQEKWSYALAGDHCTYPADGEVDFNAALSLTITPASGYTLADAACWEVTMGATTLTYGTDFTYNASTNTFNIPSVTGDVEIYVYGGRPVTWMANGSEFTTNMSIGDKITLPATNPSDCSGSGGKKFVGWCTDSSYENATTAPSFAKTGDAYSVATYYAVYATAGSSGSGSSNEYELYSGALTEGDYLIVYDNGAMNKTVTSDRFGFGTVTPSENKITTTDATIIWHIAPSGDYWTIYNAGESKYAASTGVKNKAQLLADGTDDKSKWSCTSTSSSTNYDFVNKQNTANDVNATLRKNGTYGFACYATGTGGALSLYKKSAGTTYSDYSTTCTQCALTGITLNTSGVTTSFTTEDAFSAEGLVVTASYSNCSNKTVTPTSISSPDMTSAGSKTITVTYTENEVTKTATYTINVTAVVKHTVTWKACGETFKTEQYVHGTALVLPDPAPGANDGKPFAGWTATEHYTGSTAPTLISAGGAVNADVTYYAVFH
ncbi:MAG: M6 family metalloprotease domain-containing protein [Paludibacteraceae bacterium]|nr:M6 family metalloprotease domain-containing protein [Paludibacteraceae bacterium]